MELHKSKVKNKKWAVKVLGRTVNFGDSRYEDYTQHKDKARRENYCQRHRHDLRNDPRKPGFWALRVLWGSSTNIEKNFKEAVHDAKKYSSN